MDDNYRYTRSYVPPAIIISSWRWKGKFPTGLCPERLSEIDDDDRIYRRAENPRSCDYGLSLTIFSSVAGNLIGKSREFQRARCTD